MARGWENPFELPDPLSGGGPAWADYANQLDPFGSRYDQGQSAYPDALYDYGATRTGGVNYDPLPQGDPYGAPSVEFGFNIADNNIDSWLKKQYPELFSGFGNYGTPTNPGLVGSPGGEWAGVDKWNPQILTAVQTVQKELGVYVPPNVVKSIMKIESNGEMLAPNYAGAVGLMQLTGSTMGQYDMARAATDPAYNIYAGVKELALRYKDAQAQNPAWGWSNAAVGFFSGHYEPTGAADNYNSDYAYQKAFNDNWSFLSSAGGQGGSAAPGTKEFNAIWGGFDAPITQEYGWTEFAKNSDYAKKAYGYTSEYTRDRQPMGHAGLDVGISYGTALYSPTAGTVTTSGGTGYYCDADGNGCGPGVGQLNITYANGDVLVLGHMSQVPLKVGDPVQPGQFVGYSGSENGAHVHVEYRKYVGEGVTNSGYEQIDPRLALQGMFGGAYTGAGTGPAAAASASGDWASFMTNAAKGLPLIGKAPAQGGFHDFVLGFMPGQAPKVETPTSTPGWTFGDIPKAPGTGPGGQPT